MVLDLITEKEIEVGANLFSPDVLSGWPRHRENRENFENLEFFENREFGC